MSPFDVTLLVLNPKNSEQVTAAAEALYLQLQRAGLEVLLDDRDARPGVKFAEADLLGIPHRIVVGERGVKEGMAEYRHRRSGTEEKVALNDVVAYLRNRIAAPARRTDRAASASPRGQRLLLAGAAGRVRLGRPGADAGTAQPRVGRRWPPPTVSRTASTPRSG